MKPVKLFILFAFTLSLSACAVPKHNYQPQRTEISEPPIGISTTAYIGDNMLRQGHYIEHDAILVKEKTTTGLFGYDITPGFFLKQGEDEKTEFYYPCNGAGCGQIIRPALADPWQSMQVYKNQNKLCVVTVFNVAVCTSSALFKRQKRPSLQSDSFQQTLIYSGKIGNKVNIGYREFSNSLARPSFNNDVEYDLSQSNVIGYKGARLEIIEATNELVKYKVLKNFNQASF